MKKTKVLPQPLFDTVEYLDEQALPSNVELSFAGNDFNAIKGFLKQYKNNHKTFVAYRRECERFLQWAWLIAKQSIPVANEN